MKIEVENTAVLKKHAKTFYLASLFLPKEVAADASNLYRFAREVDDIVDENKEAFARQELKKVIEAFHSKQKSNYYYVDYFREWTERVGMDPSYPEDLLLGVGWDLDHSIIENEEDLYLYCYRVAGVVGLMMCFALKIKDLAAYPHAMDLGLAMQMTNISRDVMEDLQRGRVYIPRTWLGGTYLNQNNIKVHNIEFQVVEQVVRLLRLAEKHYESAQKGMVYIPFRARFAIMVAARVYRAIGLKILKQPTSFLNQRVYVSKSEKIFWVFYCLISLFHPVYWKKQSSQPAVPMSLQSKLPV